MAEAPEATTRVSAFIVNLALLEPTVGRFGGRYFISRATGTSYSFNTLVNILNKFSKDENVSKENLQVAATRLKELDNSKVFTSLKTRWKAGHRPTLKEIALEVLTIARRYFGNLKFNATHKGFDREIILKTLLNPAEEAVKAEEDVKSVKEEGEVAESSEPVKQDEEVKAEEGSKSAREEGEVDESSEPVKQDDEVKADEGSKSVKEEGEVDDSSLPVAKDDEAKAEEGSKSVKEEGEVDDSSLPVAKDDEVKAEEGSKSAREEGEVDESSEPVKQDDEVKAEEGTKSAKEEGEVDEDVKSVKEEGEVDEDVPFAGEEGEVKEDTGAGKEEDVQAVEGATQEEAPVKKHISFKTLSLEEKLERLFDLAPEKKEEFSALPDEQKNVMSENLNWLRTYLRDGARVRVKIDMTNISIAFQNKFVESLLVGDFKPELFDFNETERTEKSVTYKLVDNTAAEVAEEASEDEDA